MSILTKKLEFYCECWDASISYYDGDNDVDSFTEWYTETYIHGASIVYYHSAVEFLTENDPSLTNSILKAHEYGYTLDDLNSELLASLLLQDILIQELESCRDDIAEHFKEQEEF